jgi:hypothetical protein
MAIMGFNPAAEMSQLRTQRTLAMQASAPAGAAAPAAATDPAAAAAAGAAAPGAAADAAIGAAGVMEPPSTSKIILQSVFKNALTGVSVGLGLKSFGPMLTKIGFIGNIVGKLPVGDAVGKGLLGFLGKLPLVGTVLPKLARLTGWQSFLATGLIGAAVGAVFGVVSGMKKAKAAAAEYAEAMAAQQAEQPPVGDPVNKPGDGAAPAPVPAKPRFKNWIVAYEGTTMKPGSTGTYKAKKGDTLAVLAKRFHTTPAEIKKLNPGVGDDIKPGTTLKLKRKVVKQAAGKAA